MGIDGNESVADAPGSVEVAAASEATIGLAAMVDVAAAPGS